MPYSNTCTETDGDVEYYGRGTVACTIGPYKSHRIYRTNKPNAVYDETDIDERAAEWAEEHDEPLWCVECESRELATVICDALNAGVIAEPA